jgi:hypothetical protein
MVLINLYGPYEGKETFWGNIFSLKCLKYENLICGGDLTIEFRKEEIWGPYAGEEILANVLKDKMEVGYWVDVDPIQLSMTWSKNRGGLEGV